MPTTPELTTREKRQAVYARRDERLGNTPLVPKTRLENGQRIDISTNQLVDQPKKPVGLLSSDTGAQKADEIGTKIQDMTGRLPKPTKDQPKEQLPSDVQSEMDDQQKDINDLNNLVSLNSDKIAISDTEAEKANIVALEDERRRTIEEANRVQAENAKAGVSALAGTRIEAGYGRYADSAGAVITNTAMDIQDTLRRGAEKIAVADTKYRRAIAEAERLMERGKLVEANDKLREILKMKEDYSDEVAKQQGELQKKREDILAEEKKAKDKLAGDVADVMKEAAKNGAKREVLDAISGAGSLTEAVILAGNSLENTGTGIVGEYNLYKKEGGTLGFDEYQTRDANRKITAAQAAANVGGLTPTQTQTFLKISDKFQADKVMESANRGKTAIDIANQVIANPDSAGNQLSILYTLVKSLDPDSAVREGELDLAQKTQSYLGKWGTTLTRIEKGQLVSPQATKELAEATKTLAQTWYDAGKRREKQYKSQANTAGVGTAFNSYLTDFERPYAEDQLNDERASKQAVDTFVVNNPDKVEMIAGMYDVEGITDQDILDYLKQAGLLQ